MGIKIESDATLEDVNELISKLEYDMRILHTRKEELQKQFIYDNLDHVLGDLSPSETNKVFDIIQRVIDRNVGNISDPSELVINSKPLSRKYD